MKEVVIVASLVTEKAGLYKGFCTVYDVDGNELFFYDQLYPRQSITSAGSQLAKVLWSEVRQNESWIVTFLEVNFLIHQPAWLRKRTKKAIESGELSRVHDFGRLETEILEGDIHPAIEQAT
jgi:hypothetical protein